MRVGIDYRILAVGPGLINRGMPRFTQQQLAAVLDIDDASEYVLLCNPGTDLDLIRGDIRAAPNVEIRVLTPTSAIEPSDATALERAEVYQQWIRDLGIDVFHATTPFNFEQPLLTDFDACPMVATLYDLIPLIFPDRYLAGWDELYMRGVGFLTRASRLLAISESAREDANLRLAYPTEKINVAFPVADECFGPLSPEDGRRALRALRNRVRVPEQCVLAVSHMHHTKNIDNLLRGYALLSDRVRARLPLVMACNLDAGGVRHVRSVATRLGVGDDLVLTGMVSDEELAGLYNSAAVFVHASRYEGFGLPVVEAMQCGTPVVTTTASSLPEVAGDAAILVDPEDPKGFALAMETVLDDPDLAEAMRQRGFAQARKFNTDRLARVTLETYRKVLNPDDSHARQTPSQDRIRLALWSPLPPQQTGVADYSAELLEGLTERCDVEVFVDGGFMPTTDLLIRHKIHHFSAYERRHAQHPFEVVLYQMGGSLFHLYMFGPLLQHPGIVTLHDLLWSQVLYTHHELHNKPTAFRAEVTYIEGPEAAREFDALPRDDAETFDRALWSFLLEHPMLQPIVTNSLAQVVHFDGAAAEIEAKYVGARPAVVPMGVSDPARARPLRLEAAAARGRAGLPAEAFVVGVFGIVDPIKRIDACLRALPELLSTEPDAILVVAGRPRDPACEQEVRGLAADLGVASHVRILGHLDRRDFDTYLMACDVIVNLRSRYMRHMSATLVRAMAAGKPVIVSDIPDWRFLPDDFCLRTPTSEGEVASLTAHLRRLAGQPDERRRIGDLARAWYETEATLEAMTSSYVDLIERVAGRRATRDVLVETVGSVA
ncbi:MAG: glycosyltransferase [Actinomycetota bacterium]|nr:glycosyltransferase [Actinomycetota bacterium]